MNRYLWSVNANGFTGKFIASQDEIDSVIGQELLLEEDMWHDYILTHFVKESDFEILSDDNDFINKLEQFDLTPVGFNPLSAKIRPCSD